MNVYWRDKEGLSPPKQALFACHPFFFQTPVPSLDLFHNLGFSKGLFETFTHIDNLPPPSSPIRVIRKKFSPEKPEWIDSVEKTTKAIESGSLEKVVLARVCILECETKPDPFAIAAHLQNRAQNATVFCFANDQTAFLGATPELLFSRKENEIRSEAVAGTIKRGENPSEDLVYEQNLKNDPKTMREILPVQSFLNEKLSPLCIAPPSFSEIHVRKTQNVQHLCSEAKGLLRNNISDLDILHQIHPTPALLGLPKQSAFDWVRENEPFERGLYGSALGWTTPQESVWMAAIRCCLIQDKTVYLYTGAGIVRGSDPKEEWEELNDKMNLYKEIFV